MSVSLYYNGVTFNDYVKSDYSERNVYTDDGKDYLYTEVTISIGCPLVPSLQSDTHSVTYYKQNLQPILTQPRGNLTYTVNGENVISQIGADVKDGPKPQEVVFEEIKGVGIYLSFTVITHIVVCDSPSQSPPNVLSNRWTMASDIDTNLLTTRTTSGRLIIKGGANLDIDDFRHFCVPPKPRGFDRKMHFVVQSDGLAMDYTITDIESHSVVPYPIAKWDASYSEVIPNGNTVRVQFTARAIGVPGSNTADVLTFLVAVAASRIDFRNPDEFITSSSIVEQLDRPEVTLTIQAFSASLFDKGFLTRVGQEVPAVGDSVIETNPGTRANFLTKLFTAAASYSCTSGQSLGNSSLASSTSNDDPGEGEGTTSEPTVSYVSELPAENSASDLQREAPYTIWQLDLKYEYDEGKVSLPVMSTQVEQTDIISVAARSAVLQVLFVAERLGEFPKLPKSIVDDDNYVLLRKVVQIGNYEKLPDGKTKYRVDGAYRYGVRDLGKIDSLKLPINPTVIDDQDLNIDDSNFNIDVVR